MKIKRRSFFMVFELNGNKFKKINEPHRVGSRQLAVLSQEGRKWRMEDGGWRMGA
jgi:hypothetical protein